MDRIIWLELAAIMMGSALSFVFPAGATMLGGYHAGTVGGAIGWIAGSLFVITIFFPLLGKLLDAVGAKAVRP